MIDEYEALRAERAALYDTVRGLTAEEWDLPSRCAGWRVRDVVAHVNLGVTISPLPFVLGMLRARGDFDRFMASYAVRMGSRPLSTLLAETEMVAGTGDIPPTTKRVDLAIDAFVHHHDIALALDRAVPSDPARLRWLADGMVGANKAIGSAQRTRGLRLIATDIDWHYGTGPEVRGPVAGLLYSGAGRGDLDHQLDGEGLAALQARRG